MPFRTLSRAGAIGLVSFLAAAPAMSAQRGTARIEGEVVDSIHAKPLAGAVVLVTRVSSDTSLSFAATTDDRGRFRLDSLPSGRYFAALTHPVLDSLELDLPPRDVTLTDGQRLRMDFTLPSGRSLRAAACAGATLAPGTGALLGRVTDAETGQSLAGAVVAVGWSDLMVDRTTLRVVEGQRSEGVRTSESGQYRLCGVPTDSWLAVQVQRDGRGGSVLRASVPDAAGVATFNLSFSAPSARPLSVEDSTEAPPLLAGSAVLAGTVRGESGQLMPGAQVRVLETAATSRTDSAGRFNLSSLPAGSQVLEVKRIGYRIVQHVVHLRGSGTSEADVRLERVVSLDSIRVVARRTRYREFEQHRKSGFGRFFDEDAIARRNPMDVSDIVRDMPGFRVVGFGSDAQVVSSRASRTPFGQPCRGANVVIDGFQHQDINWLRPQDVAAIEVYAGAAGAPSQYERSCGLIVIWTR